MSGRLTEGSVLLLLWLLLWWRPVKWCARFASLWSTIRLVVCLDFGKSDASRAARRFLGGSLLSLVNELDPRLSTGAGRRRRDGNQLLLLLHSDTESATSGLHCRAALTLSLAGYLSVRLSFSPALVPLN
jgi:hypothetical protein